MRFMLCFNSLSSDLERAADDPAAASWWSAWRSYMGSMNEAGVIVEGNVLAPPSMATTVRRRDGRRVILDGPFADTKELLGGYVIIEVGSIDEALAWAERSPSCERGSTEVRPLHRAEP